MQDIVVIAALLREISFGILLVGLFYTFGMFLIGRLVSAIGEHGTDHDVEKEIDHDLDHYIDHDYDAEHGEIEHDLDHEYDVDHGDIDHSIEHEYDVDHDLDTGYDHEIGHDVEKDIDHGVGDDIDHEVEKDLDHEVDIDHELDVEKHSGFFESDRGAPLGVTIGTSLLSFGFFGSIIYYDGIVIPFAGKFLFHFLGAALVVYAVRTVLGRVFVESGFMIEPRHLVGRQVEAVSTISDDFGEVRTDTDMGLRRFHARPFQKGVVFEKGTYLFAVSANAKFVFVDPRKEALKWSHRQSRKRRESEKEAA